MSPRSSISGELPIESYFNTSGGPAGTIGNKENTSLKRRNTNTNDANRVSTKKQRRGEQTGQSSKGKNFEIQGKFRPRAEKAPPQPVPRSSGTTSIRTPSSVAKPPRLTSATPLEAGDTLTPARNTASGSGLPTPQTVPHGGGRTGSRTGTDAVDSAEPSGVSRSAMRNGPVVSSISSIVIRPPVTPSRSKTKPNHIASAFRSTPHSQRIVPSSQWSDDEQSNLDPSRETNKDSFVDHLRHTEESDTCPNETALPAPHDIPSRAFLASSLASAKFSAPALLTFIEPSKKCPNADSGHAGNGGRKTGTLFLASSPRSKSLFSSACWPRDGGRSSQIEPTSQFDEIEMNPCQSLLVCPILPLQTNTSVVTTLIDQSQTGPLQDRSSHSEGQESSSKGCYHELSQPPSPLTPLPPSSPEEPDAIRGGTDNIGTNRSPLHYVSYKSPDSPVPPSSPALVDDGGIAQPLPEMNIPAEDPTSDSDENFSSPTVRRRPPSATAETVQNTTSRASDNSSGSAYAHIRISHAKLRSLPDSAIELDSDGEEMSSDSSIVVPLTSQGMSMSSSASSYLDLVGTLPSAIGDFLDMVNSDPSNT
ncbi:hypothetical protein BC827DRAFT_144744 [Russula dissimulans]|nr:hypothetical protein BC827DRAFT_144744 [Russula dissimulans]